MTDRGILFSAPMVRKLLSGEKTQTRRAVKYPRPPALVPTRCPYGAPGDRLWVREAHAIIDPAPDGSDSHLVVYRASCVDDAFDFVGRDGSLTRIEVKRWRPGIHLRRVDARIVLDVLSVRVERLHDITEEDARAEGAEPAQYGDITYWAAFRDLWRSINGPESWNENPLVWRIEFPRARP